VKAKSKWYKIQAKSKELAEISILGDIGKSWFSDGVTDAEFMKEFNTVKDAKEIKIYINSYGGDVFQGIAIYNIIAPEREKVSITILGVAASAASIIALAGLPPKMGSGAFFMIHNVMSGIYGNATELRKKADALDKVSDSLVNIYVERSSLSKEAIQSAMDEETWYSADEAIKAGFAEGQEEIEEEIEEMAASYDMRMYAYKHLPEKLRGSVENKVPATKREFEDFLRDSGYSRSQAVGIAAHGFELIQGEPEPETDQGEPGPVEEKAKPNAKKYGVLIRARQNKTFLDGYEHA
jgi:ATP-dependent Clp protease, protease subunit